MAQDFAAAPPGVRQEHGHVQVAGRSSTALGGRATQYGTECLGETGGDQAQRLRGRIVVVGHETAS